MSTAAIPLGVRLLLDCVVLSPKRDKNGGALVDLQLVGQTTDNTGGPVKVRAEVHAVQPFHGLVPGVRAQVVNTGEVSLDGVGIFRLTNIDWSYGSGIGAGAAAEAPPSPFRMDADPEPDDGIKQRARDAAAEVGVKAHFVEIDGKWTVMVETGRGTIRQPFAGSWPATLEHVGL